MPTRKYGKTELENHLIFHKTTDLGKDYPLRFNKLMKVDRENERFCSGKNTLQRLLSGHKGKTIIRWQRDKMVAIPIQGSTVTSLLLGRSAYVMGHEIYHLLYILTDTT